MVSRRHIRPADVHPVSGAALRIFRTVRSGSSVVRRKDCHLGQNEAFLLGTLQLFPAVQRVHHLLGMQRDRWRRNIRMRGERLPDVRCFRTFPTQPTSFQRGSPIHIPDVHMDCMGEILSGRRSNFMAMAGTGECLCKQCQMRTMVRVHRHSGRFPLGLGQQPGDIRHDGCAI